MDGIITAAGGTVAEGGVAVGSDDGFAQRALVIISYDVHLGEEVVYYCKNSTGTAIKITDEGVQEIWAKTEAKESIELDFKHGEEYFLKCSVGLGAFVGRPDFKLVENKAEARIEYEKAIK